MLGSVDYVHECLRLGGGAHDSLVVVGFVYYGDQYPDVAIP